MSFESAMLNDLLFGWVDGTYYRPLKEVQRYRIFNVDDNTSILVANTIGVKKEDLEVKMIGDVLTIKGETEQSDIEDKFSVNYYFIFFSNASFNFSAIQYVNDISIAINSSNNIS